MKMSRYLLISLLFHGAALGLLMAASAYSPPPKAYYGFHFQGGNSGFGTGNMEPAPAPAAAVQAPPAPPQAVSDQTPLSKGKDRVPAAKTAKPMDKKPSKAVKGKEKQSSTSGKKNKKGGQAGGRGDSAFGKGDSRASKTGPVGGVGTSLEIGGFGPGSSGDFGKRFPFTWYINQLYKKLWSNWESRGVGTRECTVSFTIQRDGNITGLKMLEPSGDDTCDRLALRAVEVSAPLSPLPDGFQEPELPVYVRFKLQ